MQLSLDDFLSQRMGVDNHLSPPWQSIGFWALTAMAWIAIPLAAYKRYARTGQVSALILICSLLMWGLYLLIRLNIWRGHLGEDRALLRKVSDYSNRLTMLGLVGIALALGQ